MRIDAVHIASFGKFKEHTLRFHDGFNLIYGENENGKTTVMNFIKMMFYGTSGKKTDLSKQLRKKYKPWDSDLMAGSVDFTYGGTAYRLEREFKGTNSSDKITLYNLALGTKQSLSGTNEIGQEFFGLSLSAFEKSVFIGSLGAPEKDAVAEGEINSKLSNLVATGDEDVSLETVNGRLLSAKEALMSRGGQKGIYDKNLRRLAELEEEIRRSKATEAQIIRIEDMLSDKQAALQEVNRQANGTFEILKNAELIKKRNTLQKYVEACEKIESLERQLTLKDGGKVDSAYCERLEAALVELRERKRMVTEKADAVGQLEKEVKRLAADAQDGEHGDLLTAKAQAESEINLCSDKSVELKSRLEVLTHEIQVLKPTKKRRTPLLICGGILSAAGLILTVASFLSDQPLIVGSSLLACGVLLLLCGSFFKKTIPADDGDLRQEIEKVKADIDDTEGQKQRLSLQIERLNEVINASLIESGSRKALLDNKRQELLSKKEDLLFEKDRLSEATAELLSLCAPFRPAETDGDAQELLTELKRLLQAREAAELTRNLAADGTGCDSKEEALTRLAVLDGNEAIRDMTSEQLDAAKDDFKQKSDEMGRLRGEIASLKSEIKAMTAAAESLAVLERKKESLNDTLRSQKTFCDSADLAMQVLAESFAELRQNFSSLLEEKTSVVFSGLTDGAYESVGVSKDFDVNVTKKGVFGRKEWQYLSNGTTDQVYLALRLALADLISDEAEALPLLFDDVLAQYDDKRAMRAIAYLKERANEHQILFFTCHSSYAKMANEQGIPTTTLSKRSSEMI